MNKKMIKGVSIFLTLIMVGAIVAGILVYFI